MLNFQKHQVVIKLVILLNYMDKEKSWVAA